jgi:aldehyde dehydrogenase (NAD+)
VVGAITPWNFPLQDIAVKVASALAAGCTVVLKPSEVAPLSAFRLAEVVHEVGLPPGVFNLVPGIGAVAGEALAAHPGVSMVSFTGSTRSGRRVAELAARTVKRVSLELGGKSPSIVLDDADLDWAVTDGVGKCFLNSGQSCAALSRLLVPRDRLADAETIAARAAEGFALGDPCADDTTMGPLASSEQREWVLGHIRRALADGARLLTGGLDPPVGLARGYFVRPTVFSDVTSDMAIAQEEVFGPLLSIMPYEGEAEAVAIANDTVYGLTASVWSADPERAVRMARQLRSGQVEINGGNFDLAAPFGGCKQSGYGREMGRLGLEEFLEVKSLQSPA